MSHGIRCVLLLLTEDPSPAARAGQRTGVFSRADAFSASKEKHRAGAVAEQS